MASLIDVPVCKAGMAIVFISRSRWLHLNRVEQQVRTTIVRHVRFGPLFVWHNPVAENKSSLKSPTSETSFPASQNPVLGPALRGSALCGAFEAGLFRSVEIAPGLFTPMAHEVEEPKNAIPDRNEALQLNA